MSRPIGSVRISENFVPVSEFKAQAAEWLRKAGETGAPVVVTQNGKPAGVLLSPRAFDELTERGRFVAAVEEGLADADAGRVHSHAAVARRMKTSGRTGHSRIVFPSWAATRCARSSSAPTGSSTG